MLSFYSSKNYLFWRPCTCINPEVWLKIQLLKLFIYFSVLDVLADSNSTNVYNLMLFNNLIDLGNA